MPITGLFFLPVQPNQSSPLPTIISHVSRLFPATPLPTYSFEHQLFVDTSSLLPNTDPGQRRYTHILSLSHTPDKTYVGVFEPKTGPTPVAPKQRTSFDHSLITIPSISTESFTQLLLQKLQPQWTVRQSLILEGGIAMALSNTNWIVRVGEVKNSARVGQAAGVLRGVMVELCSLSSSKPTGPGDGGDGNEVQADEKMLRAFWEALFRGAGIELDNTVVLVAETEPVGQKEDLRDGMKSWERGSRHTTNPPIWDLANMYMDMLRVSRG